MNQARNFFFILLAGVLVLIVNSSAVAAENLDEWDELPWLGNVQITTNGTSMDITADGSEGLSWRALTKKYTDSVGLMATVNVADFEGQRVEIGIRKNVGKTPSGNWVLAELFLDVWEGQNNIRFRVQERDADLNSLKVLSVGHLGDYDGGWAIGKEVVIGLARVNNEIWFYTPGNGALVKVCPAYSMSTVESDVYIYGYANGESNNISGTVSNVNILYANNLKELDPRREKVEAFVTRFYEECLGRKPDAKGLRGWALNLLNQIQTGADVAHGFINSNEFIEKNTTPEEYLTVLYYAFFNRKPDADGLAAWLAELKAGKARAEVLYGFLYSSEFSELCDAYGIKPY